MTPSWSSSPVSSHVLSWGLDLALLMLGACTPCPDALCCRVPLPCAGGPHGAAMTLTYNHA